MRTFISITIVFLLFFAGGVYLFTAYTAPIPSPTTTTQVQQAVTQTPPTAATASIDTPDVKASGEVTVPHTTPASTCTRGGSCTAAEVAQHNTRADCYVSMSDLGKVYDVTAYVQNRSSMHPGGDIAEYCGMDIARTFTGADGSHRHSGRAMQDLSAYAFASLQ